MLESQVNNHRWTEQELHRNYSLCRKLDDGAEEMIGFDNKKCSIELVSHHLFENYKHSKMKIVLPHMSPTTIV